MYIYVNSKFNLCRCKKLDRNLLTYKFMQIKIDKVFDQFML